MTIVNKHKEDSLSWNMLIDELIYDKDTGYFIWNVSRPGVKKGKRAGGVKQDGYRRLRLQGESFLEHRLAWFYVYKKWPLDRLDHIDRNKENNSIYNLREVSTRLNGCNREDTSEYGPNIYFTNNAYRISMQHMNKSIMYSGFNNLKHAKEIRLWILNYINEFNELPKNTKMLWELISCLE